jgi:glutamate dehydrogenase
MSSESIKQKIFAELDRIYKNTLDNQLLSKFARSFYSYMPLDYNDDYDIDEFVNIAIRSFKCFGHRVLGKHQIYTANEITSEDGNEGSTFIWIVNDDMPFIVDSITELLTREEYHIRKFINALFLVERDKNCQISNIINEYSKPNESVLYIKLDLIKDSIALNKLLADISKILLQVRTVVSDWKPVLLELNKTIDLCSNTKDENCEFLQWLSNHNFTFTGYREYTVSGQVKHRVIKYDHTKDLGIFKFNDHDLNKDIVDDIFTANDFFSQTEIVRLGKIKTMSKVHRYSSLDCISIIKQDNSNQLTIKVFIGLFASKLDYQSVLDIPLIRNKVIAVVTRAGFNKSSFLGKELFSIVETLPKDELFLFTEDDLFRTLMKILSCLNNPRLLVFARTTCCKNFFNLLVFFPKSRVTSDIVDKVQNVVKEFVAGKIIDQSLKISSMALAYVYITVAVKDNSKVGFDINDIEKKLDNVTSLWNEKMGFYIEQKFGKTNLNYLLSIYNKAFPTNYHANFTIEDAVNDIGYIESFTEKNNIIFNLYQKPKAKKNQFNLKIYSLDSKIELFKILPIIENLGFKSLEESIFILDISKYNQSVFIQDFTLLVSSQKLFNLQDIKHNIEDAISGIYKDKLKNDIINGLVLAAGLNLRRVFMLSAYCKYMMQINFPYSQEYIHSVLVKHPAITKYLVELFYSMFDKNRLSEDKQKLKNKIRNDLDKILDSAEDKVIRKVWDLINNTLRTNYFQKDSDNNPKQYLSIKLNSAQIEDLPQPKPFVEIFVYSSRMEGIHLRGGKVARGGIRWSDRREDYRTEILALMKAQMSKNAIIVPVGSKGGFFVNNVNNFTSRDEYLTEGVECYKILLRGMLDITDNIINRHIVHPKDVVCLDGDDPYLVVAADKGTATFSDIANQVSQEYNFWLGDAFASGGSFGYDHKKMGITARGAWISVEEHAKSLGFDLNKDIFTVIGIGDMSGDVFGNGMLLSKNIQLVAAFNHLHIFIDPNPSPLHSFEERKRLFDLPRSSWSDYNHKVISQGGGVFERSSKVINVSPQIKELLEIENDTIDPDTLIRKILTAKVDLLWNGGIGTYVKAESETNEQIGNKSNDNLRVNGRNLRCRMVGEGGNLGFTQLARIEYEFNGGKINTDAIDNSAGVDCSDHEVNIKIALSPSVANKKMTLDARDKLLVEMTDEVADLVLYDNKIQNQSLSISSSHSVKMFESYVRLMYKLEQDKLLDRKIEFLPNDEVIISRVNAHLGFTRPEISVLMAYSKNAIDKDLIKSKLVDDEYFNKYLISYFPVKMQKECLDEILSHQLRREIISTMLANKLINYLGSYFFHSAQEYTGLNGCDIARAFCIVWEIFALEKLWDEVDKLDNSTKTELFCNIQSFVQNSIYWFLRYKPQTLNIEKSIKEFGSETKLLINNTEKFLIGEIKEKFVKKCNYFSGNNVPDGLAKQLASLEILYSAMDIILVTVKHSIPSTKVSEIYFAIGDRFNLDWLKHVVEQLPANTYWNNMLIKTIKDDIYDQQRRLTSQIIKFSSDISKSLDEWIKVNAKRVGIFDQFINSIKNDAEFDVNKLVVVTKQIEILTHK